jgi:hypothetical protein
MSSLRRDLFERKLWPLIVLLLAALVAVPLVLLKNAAADGTPTPPPPAAAPAAPAGTTGGHSAGPTKTVSVKVLIASIPRNPFASGMPTLRAKPASNSTAAAGTSSPTATSSTTTTTAAMVSPSPAATPATTPASVTPPATGTLAPTPAGSTTTTSTTATIAAPTTPVPPPVKVRSWTLYSVSLRYGTDAGARVRTDVARLTALPSAKQPQVMFMGVLGGGQQAVFALGAGIRHQGPGLCRPSRARCAALQIKGGQTETIILPTASGGTRQVLLRVVRIVSSITHSRSVALAAYQRHSAAGLCALDLANPVAYSPVTGTLARVAGAACKTQHAAVPFPYPVVGQ